MLDFGLNQVTMSEAPLGDFLDVAAQLGCVGVELRNDLARPVFDESPAREVRERVQQRGLRLLGLSEVYPINRWSDQIADELCALITLASEAGAETINLIPCNDGTGTDAQARRDDLDRAIEGCLPLLKDAKIVALIEPLGFQSSSLRLKSELIGAIARANAGASIRIVHDTFHHALAGETEFYAKQTGIVHISGVSAADLQIGQMEDERRVLVDGQDRLDNLGQIQALRDAGYTGVFSFECFAPEVRNQAQPTDAIQRSIDFISTRTQQIAA